MSEESCGPSPFEVGHQIVAVVHPATTPAGNEELVVHIGGFLFTSPDDPRLQYSVMEWAEHAGELDWNTPAMCMRNLLGLNDLLGQVMAGILRDQVQMELKRRRAQGDETPEVQLPDIILAGLVDVNLDPQEGEADAKKGS